MRIVKNKSLTLSSYQNLEPEIKTFIDYFYSKQIKSGDFESIPYYQREYNFITYSKRIERYSSQFYLYKTKKHVILSDSFHNIQQTLVRINELMNQTEKSILVIEGSKEDAECYKLSTFHEALTIYAKITNDNYFSIYIYKAFLSSTSYFAVSTIKGYSILFDIGLSLLEDNVLIIKSVDFLVRYISEEFQYLKNWSSSQLRRYCRNNDIIPPIRKIEIIKVIQDSNPAKRPHLVFIDRLIKKPEVFKDIVLQFLGEDDIGSFTWGCFRCLYISGMKDINPIVNELKDLSTEETIDILFSNMKEYWSKDNDFTRIYSGLPKRELDIKEYIKKKYPNQFDYIFPHFFKEHYKKTSPMTIFPEISINFQKAFKKYKKNIDILGFQGEKYIYEMLKKEKDGKLNTKITWNNQEEELFKPFDILLKVGDEEYYIEVKTSINDKTTFTVTERELNFALQHEDRYTLYHIINFNSDKMAYRKYKNLGKLMKEGKIEIISRSLKANL